MTMLVFYNRAKLNS